MSGELDKAWQAVVISLSGSAGLDSEALCGHLVRSGFGDIVPFTYVGNAVLATLLAGSTERGLKGEAVNVGTGSRIDLTRLAALMADKIGRPHLRPTHQPARAGDVRHSQADLSRARDLLGYEPFASLEDGISETLEWLKQSLVSR